MRKRNIVIILLILIFTANHSLAQMQSSDKKVFTMEECIQLALKSNLDVIYAENYYKYAKNDVWTAWGTFLPRVDTYLSRGRTRSGPSSSLSIYPESLIVYPDTIPGRIQERTDTEVYTSNSNERGITASLSFGLGNIFNIAQSNANKNSAYNNYILAKQNLILLVKQSYFELLKARMLLTWILKNSI